MGHITKNYQFWRFAFLFIQTFLLQSTGGQGVPRLKLQDYVFVAFKGENLSITYELTIPPNQSEDHLSCFDPLNNVISQFPITPTTKDGFFVLKNTAMSGQYYCEYKTAKASWFLRVRDSGYKEEVWDYTEVITVFVVTGLLLAFSVAGSVYVFRGHWKCKVTKKNKDERQEDMGATANDPAQSTSFYASLEARPGSIYDELDHSASASGQTERTTVKTSKRKEGPKVTVDKSPQNQDEGIFECIYENF